MPFRRYCTAGRSWLPRRAVRPAPSILEYHFDRLLPDKLVQGYELLASDRRWPIAPSPQPVSCQEVVNEQTGRALRQCFPSIGKRRTTPLHSQVAALTQFAETKGYLVPPEWQFQDDGYSGATLVRPGLEALRDLAATGEIQSLSTHPIARVGNMPIKCCWPKSWPAWSGADLRKKFWGRHFWARGAHKAPIAAICSRAMVGGMITRR